MSRLTDVGLQPSMETGCPLCFGIGTIAYPYGDGTSAYVKACTCGAEHPLLPGTQYAGTHHPQVILRYEGRIARVDEGIAEDILMLWRAGIWTWVSCQGDDVHHRRYVCITDPSKTEKAKALLPWVTQVYDRTEDEMGDVILGGVDPMKVATDG